MNRLTYNFFSPGGLKKNKTVSGSSLTVLEEAEKHGIDWKIIPGTQIISLTYNGRTKSYYHQVPSSTTALAKYITNNKKITSNLLQQAEVTISKSFRISKNHTNKYFKLVFDSLNKPLVVKPSTGFLGDNITLNIDTYKKYLEAINLALDYSYSKKNNLLDDKLFDDDKLGIVVEEMFHGTEYRVLATRDKIIGVTYRKPANITGDGKNSIKKLIKIKNREPIRASKTTERSHLKIRINNKLIENLEKQRLDLNSIVQQGKTIYLRKVSNISQGGDAYDFTDKVHKSVKEISLKAIRAIPGLSFAGIDFMSKDITAPQTKDSYVIIEINNSPGFDIHDYPYKGKNRHAAREFLFLMFPELEKN